jgi:cytochrome c-type biogenesis protein
LVAFGAGILSFLSPCVLPLVPGYLSMVSGLSAAELSALGHDAADPESTTKAAAMATTTTATTATTATIETTTARAATETALAAAPAIAPATATSTEAGAATATTTLATTAAATASATRTTRAATRRPMLTGIGLFVGGFTIVFVALGAAASGIGRVLDAHQIPLAHVSGIVVILLGLLLLLGALPGEWWSRLGAGPLGFVTRLNGERRFDVRPSALGVWAAPVMGMAFAFAWTPCIGPVLGSVLALASHNGSLSGGVLLLFAYSLGLGVPFVATGLAFERLTEVFARARRTLGVIEVVAALILIVFGILLVTDNVAWVSTQFTNLFDHLGLSRLSKS